MNTEPVTNLRETRIQKLLQSSAVLTLADYRLVSMASGEDALPPAVADQVSELSLALQAARKLVSEVTESLEDDEESAIPADQLLRAAIDSVMTVSPAERDDLIKAIRKLLST